MPHYISRLVSSRHNDFFPRGELYWENENLYKVIVVITFSLSVKNI